MTFGSVDEVFPGFAVECNRVSHFAIKCCNNNFKCKQYNFTNNKY